VDDPRFHLGLAHFNAGEFFDAHEVWEELWHDCPAIDRRFVQSLIQAAVAIYHWGNGNSAGARTLLARGRAKAADYPPVYYELPLAEFWKAVEETVLNNTPPPVLPSKPDSPLP
jgi:predicted metal-dependent hydrolase